MSVFKIRRSAFALLATTSVVVAVPVSAEEVAPEQDEREHKAGTGSIVVTGLSLNNEQRVALPVVVLSGDELAHRRQGGLGETLAGLPGVHLDNFGGGASRPVIRGQTVPRIEILTDGANLFDASSVSPDHAITTDPLLLDAIELQRGPAAARYGGNALNGAINLIDGKIPKSLPAGNLTGATEVRLGTGDQERTVVGRVTAGVGPFALHAEGSRRNSQDYDVPDAFGTDKLRDSFAEGSSYSVGASWISSKGYIGAAYTRQDSEYGLPGHSHANAPCHTHGTDLHCETHGNYTDPFAGSDDTHTAYIKLRNERVDVRADYDDLLPGFEHTRLRLSYTDYVHDEIDGPFLFSRYGNEVYDGRLELTHRPVLGFTGTLGVQYTNGKFSGLNYNTAHRNDDFYTFETESFGLFLTERKSFGSVDLEIAARQDWRTMNAVKKHWTEYYILPPGYVLTPELEELYKTSYDSYFARHYPSSKHNPFSASLGLTWNAGNGYSAGLTIARSQRAPSVRELYARGNNLATNSYEVGLARTATVSNTFPAPATDIVETNKSIDLTFRKQGGPTQFEIGFFYQDIDDYVYARLIEEEQEVGHLFLLYTAVDARFLGVDGQISHQFSPSSRVTIFGDYVDAKLKDENDNLPRIPPGRLGVRYDLELGPLTADVEYYRTFAQNRFASYESRTPGFDMVNATVAYRYEVSEGKGVEFYLRGTNLTNQLAYSHTSFVKDQSPLRGRSVVVGMRHMF